MLDIHRRLRLYDKRHQTQREEEARCYVFIPDCIGAFEVGTAAAEGGAAGVEGRARRAVFDGLVGPAALFFAAEEGLLGAAVCRAVEGRTGLSCHFLVVCVGVGGEVGREGLGVLEPDALLYGGGGTTPWWRRCASLAS